MSQNKIRDMRNPNRNERIYGDSLPEIKRLVGKLVERMIDLGYKGLIKGDYSELQVVNYAMCNLLSLDDEAQKAFLDDGGKIFKVARESDKPLTAEQFRAMRRSDYVHPGGSVHKADGHGETMGDDKTQGVGRGRKVRDPSGV